MDRPDSHSPNTPSAKAPVPPLLNTHAPLPPMLPVPQLQQPSQHLLQPSQHLLQPTTQQLLQPSQHLPHPASQHLLQPSQHLPHPAPQHLLQPSQHLLQQSQHLPQPTSQHLTQQLPHPLLQPSPMHGLPVQGAVLQHFSPPHYPSAYPPQFLQQTAPQYSLPMMPVSYAYMGMPMGAPVASPYAMIPVEHRQMAYAYGGYNVAAPPGPAPAANKHRRFRRRYYQIFRKYNCTFPGCTKSYGSLNHLNTHIVTKKHGLRKSKQDFKHVDEKGDPRAQRTYSIRHEGASSLGAGSAPASPKEPDVLSPRSRGDGDAESAEHVYEHEHRDHEQSEHEQPEHEQAEHEDDERKTAPQDIVLPVQEAAPAPWEKKTERAWSYTLPQSDLGLARTLPPAIGLASATREAIRLPLLPSIMERCNPTA